MAIKLPACSTTLACHTSHLHEPITAVEDIKDCCLAVHVVGQGDREVVTPRGSNQDQVSDADGPSGSSVCLGLPWEHSYRLG